MQCDLVEIVSEQHVGMVMFVYNTQPDHLSSMWHLFRHRTQSKRMCA